MVLQTAKKEMKKAIETQSKAERLGLKSRFDHRRTTYSRVATQLNPEDRHKFDVWCSKVGW